MLWALWLICVFGAILRAQPGLDELVQTERLVHEGEYAEARRTALVVLERALLRGDLRLPLALHELGTVCHDRGQLQHAAWFYQKAIAAWEQSPEPSLGLATTLTSLAVLRVREKRAAEAERLYQRAIGVLEVRKALMTREAAVAYTGLAEMYVSLEKYREAEDNARRALAISAANEAFGRERGIALYLLAVVRLAQKQSAEVESLMRQAVAAWEASLGRSHPTTASGLSCLATIVSRKAPLEAERLFAEALRVLEREFGPEHPETGSVLESYAKLLRQRGRKQEAKVMERRSAAIAARNKDMDEGRHRVDWSTLQSGKH